MGRKIDGWLIFLGLLISFCLLTFDSQAALVAHWNFDEAGGSTQVVDTVGGLVGNLSATGATLVSGGRAGGALSLDKGSGGYVTMGDILRLGTGPYSFVVWVKTSSTEATTVVIAKQQEGIPPGYHISINENGDYGLPGKAWLYNYFPANSPVSITSVNDGLWHQIVGVRGNNQVKIYVDGFPVEGSQPDQGLDNPIPGTPFLVGGYPFGGNPVGTYTGLIDDIQVYNHMLSDEEVQWLYEHPGQIHCTPVPSGLVSWWRAEGNAKDFWDSNHGTLVNGAAFVAGKVGQAFNLSGTDDYVQVSSPVGLPVGNSPRTMMLWFKTPSNWGDSYQVLIQYGGSYQGGKFGLYIPDYWSRTLSFWGESRDFQGSTPLQLNTWYHGAVTYDGSTVSLYLNGQFETSQTNSWNTQINSNGFILGGAFSPDLITSQWNGLVDEAAIFNRVLSPQEIATIYNAGSAGICAVKTIYLPLILKN